MTIISVIKSHGEESGDYVLLPTAEIVVNTNVPTETQTENVWSTLATAAITLGTNFPTVENPDNQISTLETGSVSAGTNPPLIEVTGGDLVTLETATISLGTAAPVVEVTGEQEQPQTPIHHLVYGSFPWLPDRLEVKKPTALKEAPLMVTARTAELRLKTNAPEIKVTGSVRTVLAGAQLQNKGVEPRIVVQYDKRRAQEERELIEIIGALGL